MQKYYEPAAAWYFLCVRTYAVASFCVTTPRFACGSKALTALLVCGFSALRAEKPHTIEKSSTALPKAQCANCVHPILFARPGESYLQKKEIHSLRTS